MKRLHLIILLVAVTISGMAQNVGEAFYIYRNDGQFNAFFRDEVISMEYSYEDADGNTYDFAFGLNWKGVIKDKRVKRYKK